MSAADVDVSLPVTTDITETDDCSFVGMPNNNLFVSRIGSQSPLRTFSSCPSGQAAHATELADKTKATPSISRHDATAARVHLLIGNAVPELNLAANPYYSIQDFNTAIQRPGAFIVLHRDGSLFPVGNTA